jgi:hypothetical protein
VFYPVKVLAPETGRFMSVKPRGAARRSARRQALAPAGQVKAGTALVQITAQRTYLLDEEIGLALERSESSPDEFRRQLAELLVKDECDQDAGSLRRGEGQQQTTYEILNPVGLPSPGSGADANAAAVSPDGLSAFVARVLDQLSLSAWFPAALFTVSLAILLQFRRQGSDSLPHAVRVLTADPVRVRRVANLLRRTGGPSRARAGEAGKIESSLVRAGQAAIPARRVRSSMAAW